MISDTPKLPQFVEEALDGSDRQMVAIPGQVCKHNKSHLIKKRDEKTDRPGEYMPTFKPCQDNEDSEEPDGTHYENTKYQRQTLHF
jgi:hypothetical protein